MRNELVSEMLRVESGLEVVKKSREAKCLSREKSVAEKVMTGEAIGKRPRGQPRKCRKDPF